MDGVKGAALPLIRHDLGLSYEQVGLLASVPLLVGGFLELPMGVLAGQGRRRRLVILGGGVLFLLTVLAVLSAVTAPWYPVLQARLYGSLPGRSSVAVTLSSAAGLAGGLGPLAVGLVAEGFGLSWALAGLVIVPTAVLLVPGRARSPDRVRA